MGNFLKGYLGKAVYDILKWLFINFGLPSLAYLIFLSYKHFSNGVTWTFSFRAVVVIFVVYILIRIAILAKRLYNTYIYRGSLISGSGLFYFSKNATSDEQSKSRELLLEKVGSASPVNMIGATGFNTFVKEDSNGMAVLKQAFEKAEGEIRILLLHPFEGEHQRPTRAASLKMSWEDYKKEIMKSIEFLRDLVKEGKDIKLKFYNQVPIWKMIRVDDFIWLQYYHLGVHVAEEPVYGFVKPKGVDNDNLFNPLNAIFKKKWNCDNNPSFNFDSNKIIYPNGKTMDINTPV